ncbi:phytoene desaturase [Hyphococcus luteus]|uniref:Phytoene dehydrogenase n=1 Tax=Hyphococcus luteus TaxID=2058213 RepID=A0A2S7K4Q4_9PROT|nr:phytoene desaturase [Marinicaulis flavus]PQA87461.1 phytoene desaturase [Marinicaulis flavus]
MSEVKKAAVIGAGFGGLALAIRLQSAGIETKLFEKRDMPGGRAYVYKKDGFTFDAGPTVITDPSALEELFALTGRKLSDYVELINVDPFYRLCWEDGYTFDYCSDEERLYKQIEEKNPEDLEGYKRFYEFSEKVFEEGYVKLGAVPFLNFWSMIRVAPQLTQLQSFRSVYGRLSDFIKDPQLRQAFSFHTLLVGGDPFKTSSIYALIHALERKWGVWFPRGGTGALVSGLARFFTDLGGEIYLNAPVAELTTKDGLIDEVVLEDGRRERFDAVASNADIVHTYDKLLGKDARGASMGRSLKGKRFSNSLFVAYFGLKKKHDHLAHHSILFGPRYRELISEIFSGPDLPDDFSLYLHMPTKTDPALAPEGCSAFYALAPVPNLEKAKIDWSVEGPKYRDRIFDYLEKRYIPGLREDLVTSHIFTPADFETELNAHAGSAFSIEPILTQSAYFRTHNRDDKIPNLYFAGAGTHPGAGVPGVVGSAKATAGLMLEDLAPALKVAE